MLWPKIVNMLTASHIYILNMLYLESNAIAKNCKHVKGITYLYFKHASVYICFVVTCWERADLLALVCGV